MPTLFYKKPPFIEKALGPLSYGAVHQYSEKAVESKSRIPDRLSFDNVMEGKTLPPCSLNDFMDYLVYVSRDAENLQFLLWLRDYTKRFSDLPQSEAALSPEWAPDTKALVELKSSAHSKMISPNALSKERLAISPSTSDLSSSRKSSKNSLDQDLNPQGQPFRAEVNLMIQHYLINGSPRELNLSFRVRGAILEALQRTTHPSAFAPLRDLTEQSLRNQSHPNFIRWAISNGRPPRCVILRQVTIALYVSFIAGEIALILSHYSRWIRIALSPLLINAIMMMHSVMYGFCLILAIANERELRPWEMFDEDDESLAALDPFKHVGDSNYSSMPGSLFSFDDLGLNPPKLPSFDTVSQLTRSTTGTPKSRLSRMNTFGPANAFDQESWVEKWNRMTWWRKGSITVSLGKVPSLEEGIKGIHNQILYQSMLWAAIVTVPVTAAVVALPVFGLY